MRFSRSRQSYLAGLLGILALVGAGCGSSHKNGGAYVNLEWSIFDLGDTVMASPLNCADVGAGAVVLTLVGSSGTYTDTFTCATLQGASAYVPSGSYNITLDLYGDPAVYGNNTTLLDTLSAAQTLVNGPNTLGAIDFQVNSYVLGWSISSSVGTTCASVGATWVELDVLYSGQTQPVAYTFSCKDYRSATTAIDMGSYAIQWWAILQDSSYRPLSTTQSVNYSVYNSATSRTQADLGTAYFPLP